MNGWAGKILDVDLTTGKIKKHSLDIAWAKKYLGGSGFIARVLYDEVGPETNPLGPENITLVAQGPLSGTLSPSSGRYEVAAKSPITGILGRSNGGGNFGPEMKWAGYDLIMVRGKSERPVYLWLEDDHVELKDAGIIWGKTISVSRDLLLDELGDAEVATLLIGPAGEHRCLTSCIISDTSRAAGKTGIGAVWGSKNFKGIAARGTRGVNIAKPDEFLKLCKELWQRMKLDPIYETHSKYGTSSWVGSAYSRSAAGRALSGGIGAKDIEEKALDAVYKKNLACFACPLHCGHYYRVDSGKYKGTVGEGIEGNVQIWGIGMRCVNAPFLCKYNSLCNELGLNVDAPAVAINWAMKLWEAGIITKEDTDGLVLTWGNEEAVLGLTRKIAYKEGFGAVLDGHPLRAAKQINRGAELYASHNKGLYTYNFGPGLGTTLIYTLALNVATRGFDHLTGYVGIYTPDMRDEWGITREFLTRLGKERYGDPKVFTEAWSPNPNKARVLHDVENFCALADMTGVCQFAGLTALCDTGVNSEDISSLLTMVTGEPFALDDVTKAAETKFALERAFNAREGIRRIDDYPFFLRWLLEKGKPNPLFDYDQLPLNLETYDIVLDEYYRTRGCDLKTGIPTEAKLRELGLEDVARDLTTRNIAHHVKS